MSCSLPQLRQFPILNILPLSLVMIRNLLFNGLYAHSIYIQLSVYYYMFNTPMKGFRDLNMTLRHYLFNLGDRIPILASLIRFLKLYTCLPIHAHIIILVHCDSTFADVRVTVQIYGGPCCVSRKLCWLWHGPRHYSCASIVTNSPHP